MVIAMIRWVESDGVGMRIGYALVFTDSVGSPVDIQDQKPYSQNVFKRPLLSPRFVLVRPSDIAIIWKFRLVSFFKFLLP